MSKPTSKTSKPVRTTPPKAASPRAARRTKGEEAVETVASNGRTKLAIVTKEVGHEGRNGRTESRTVGIWESYVSGGKNRDGETIDDVYARSVKFVVYRRGDLVIPEGDEEFLRRVDAISSLVSRVRALMPKNPGAVRAVNVELARAYDLCLNGWLEDSKAVLNQLLTRLEGSHIAMARLHYLWAGIVTSAVCWVVILISNKIKLVPPNGYLWFQAIGIGGTGGFFAVALAQSTIPIDLSHSTLVHWTAGAARILVAMAAALACMLAIKGGIFMAVASNSSSSAGYPELFFCFVAGFSETFVQKLLRDNERPGGAAEREVPERPRAQESPKKKER